MGPDAKMKYRNCAICALRCVLAEGKPGGACGLYELREGSIAERFGDTFLVACPISIETMPILHFHPGAKFFQISTTGCNLDCPGCISTVLVREMSPDSRALKRLDAEQVVDMAEQAGCEGIAFLMNDPLIPLSGGENVHRCVQRTLFGMQKISIEQVLEYDPQAVVSHEEVFFERLAADPKWKGIRAVRDGRVYRIPRKPFNWFDRPPSFMRILGIQWMMRKLYPERYPLDLPAETRRFYKLFLNVDLDDAAIRELLHP